VIKSSIAKLRRLETLALWSLLALLISALASGYYELLAARVFGHDEVHYYPNFMFKLVEEGRWINYLLHDFLRRIDLHVHLLLYVASFSTVIFVMAFDYCRDKVLAAALACAVMLSTPMVEQALWPASLWPTGVALLGLLYLQRSGVKAWALYLLGGALLFGMMQNWYFLLPLFFVRDVGEKSPSSLLRNLITHTAWWIIGAAVGLAVMLCLVALLSGRFGIRVADWRHAQSISSLSDLMRNVGAVLQALTRESIVLYSSFQTALGPFAFILGVALLVATWIAPRRVATIAILTCLAGLGFFVFSVPLAPIIQTRSVVVLWIAVLLFGALSVGMQAPYGKLVAVISLTLFGLGSAATASQYFGRHRAVTDFVYESIVRVLPSYAGNYKRIAVFGQYPGDRMESDIMNIPAYLRPIVLATGVPEFWDCRPASDRCKGLGAELGEFLPNQPVKLIGVLDGTAMIAFGEPTTEAR
jgi:hypothetical protein